MSNVDSTDIRSLIDSEHLVDVIERNSLCENCTHAEIEACVGGGALCLEETVNVLQIIERETQAVCKAGGSDNEK